MFEIFEPLIRHNCGKIFALAGIGAISITIVSYQLIAGIFSYMKHII